MAERVLVAFYLALLFHRTTDNKLQKPALLTKHFRITPKTMGLLLEDHDIIIRIRKLDASAANYFLMDMLYSNVTLCPFSHSMKGHMTELERGPANVELKRLPPPLVLHSSLAFWPRTRGYVLHLVVVGHWALSTTSLKYH